MPGDLDGHRGLSFPLEELQAQGRPLSMVLPQPGGGVMQLARSHSSYPSDAMCPGLSGTVWVHQPHPRVLGFSQWCLCSQIVVSCSSCGGNEVRNDLCRHPGDVTLISAEVWRKTFFFLREISVFTFKAFK